MPAREVVLKPITDKKTVQSLKKVLKTSSVDKEAIEKAKIDLKTIYGFNCDKSNDCSYLYKYFV